MRPRHPTALLDRSSLRIPAQHRDDYPVSRRPVVWPLDEGVSVLIAGRRYLAANPQLDRIECRIIEASSLAEAQEIVAVHHSNRPSIRSLRRLHARLSKLEAPSTEERAFAAAIEYVTTGLAKGWPPRIDGLR